MSCSTAKHPLTQLLYSYQLTAYNKIYPIIEKCAQYYPCLPNLDPATKPRSDSQSSSHNEAQTSVTDNSSSHNVPSAADVSSLSSPVLTPGGSHANYDVNNFDDLFEDDLEPSKDKGEGQSECDARSDSTVPSDSDADRLSTASMEELEKAALVRHFQNVSREVNESLDKLQAMFIVAYEELDNPTGKDLCYSCIEEPFFKPIWPYILHLARYLWQNIPLCVDIMLKNVNRKCIQIYS